MENFFGRLKAEMYYGKFIYPELENIPLRLTITHRNKYMIDCADLVIACVPCVFGGAFKTLQYAKRKNKQIANALLS